MALNSPLKSSDNSSSEVQQKANESTSENPFGDFSLAKNPFSAPPHSNPWNNNSNSSPTSRNVGVIQGDFARPLPNAEAVPREMSPEEIQSAIEYNEARFHSREELRLIQDVLGLPHEQESIDESFVRAVLRWQAMNGVVQDGKIGGNTARLLAAEFQAEGLNEESERMGVRTRGSQWIRNFDNKFDAQLDHDDAILKLHVKIKFNMPPAGSYADFDGTMVASPGWPNQQEKDRWIRQYRRTVEGRWSMRYGLIQKNARNNRYLDYYRVRVLVTPVESGQHHTVRVVYITSGFFRSSAGVGSASLDALDIRGRDTSGGNRQRGTEHEFGHMIGLDHPGGSGSGSATYAADAASIMGSGSAVRSSNYQPFVDAIDRITGLDWETSRENYTD